MNKKMKIISVNLKKRLGNPQIKRYLEYWLLKHECDLFICQEPWHQNHESHIELNKYDFLGGTSYVASWIKKGYAVENANLKNDNWQLLKINYLIIHNIYLSPYSGNERIDALNKIILEYKENRVEPIIILGDFNFAPEKSDGLYGFSISTWTSSKERQAFSNLLSELNLVDLMSKENLGKQEYSYERMRKEISLRFRCDLLLASDYISNDIDANYDHTSRVGNNKFTDHSAICFEAPVTLEQKDLFSNKSNNIYKDREKFFPYKTTIPRKHPSKIARVLINESILKKLAVKRILDYGCGYGQDVYYYRQYGYKAEGYDTHIDFGWSRIPHDKFDLVTLVFVANVLPNPQIRLTVINECKKFLRNNGYLLIVSRSPMTIQREVENKKWQKYNDGYISHPGKMTFQKGITEDEMMSYVNRLNFDIVQIPIKFGNDVSFILARLRS
jgi:SAM-dependent methyltransferase/exonuclease III